MTRTHGAGTHLEDGEIVRLLDHEVSQGERRECVRHLSGCDECARRMETLRAQSEGASRYLARVGGAAPVDELARARALAAARDARRRGGRRLPSAAARAAMVAGVLALGVATVEPLRAWVLERWADLVAPDGIARVEAERPRPAPDGGSLVSFPTGGTVFTVRFDHAQDAGELVIQRHPGDLASAQIVRGAGETMLVLPSGLRVQNTPDSSAGYLLVVPPSVQRVEVTAGDGVATSIELDGEVEGWSRSVPLAGPAAGR